MKTVFVYLILVAEFVAARRLTNNDSGIQLKDKAIERLSKVFGLPVNSASLPTRDPPQYMLDLYNSVADSNGVTRSKNPYNATVIRSFLNKGSVYSDVVFFDVSGINPKEQILQAELHLHRHKLKLKSHRSKSLIYQVKVYQIIDFKHKSVPERNRLIAANYIDVAVSGWEIINLTPAVMDWATGKSPNYGLLVTLTSLHGHVTDLRILGDEYSQQASKTPILVVFSSETSKTDAADPLPANYKDTEHNYNEDLMNNQLSRKKRSFAASQDMDFDEEPTTACQLSNMYVDFEKIGWSSWIISPKGYNAFHCKGICSFPLGQNQRPTNHATVQSIVSQLELVPGVKQPCCVASKLLSLTLLYFDDQDNVVLKQYDDMVADGCGCH